MTLSSSRWSGAHKGNRSRAFTILEVCVSMVVVALLLAIAIPTVLSRRAERNLRLGQRELAQFLVYARTVAVGQGGAQVTFESRSAGVACVLRNGAGVVIREALLPRPITVSPSSALEFRANGSLAPGGTLTLSSGSTSCALQLQGPTGGVVLSP